MEKAESTLQDIMELWRINEINEETFYWDWQLRTLVMQNLPHVIEALQVSMRIIKHNQPTVENLSAYLTALGKIG